MSGNCTAGLDRLAAISAQSLGWRPDDFWNATPAELAAALRDPSAGSGGGAGMTRTDLDRLLESDNDRSHI